MNNYYNTNRETGATLKNSNAKASTQEQEILALFQSKQKLTASEALSYYSSISVPLTSIRRAISNLTKKGLLIKTNARKMGLYGKQEHVYRLVEKHQPVQVKPGQMALFKMQKAKINDPT